jgi:hypothetical protein
LYSDGRLLQRRQMSAPQIFFPIEFKCGVVVAVEFDCRHLDAECVDSGIKEANDVIASQG